MAKRQRKTKTMSEAIKPTIKKAPKKATPKKKSTVTTSNTKKKVTKKPVTTKKSTTKGKSATKKTTKSTTTKRVTTSTPRKRTTKKPVVKKPAAPVAKKVENLKVVPKPKGGKKPVNDNRYIRVSSKSKGSKFVEMGDKVQRGEVKWVYYAVDGDIGYHYYLKLKKKK